MNPYATRTWERIHGSDELLEYPLEVGRHSVVGMLYVQDNYFTEPVEFEVIPEPSTFLLFTFGMIYFRRYKA